jgi:hypothetical protein
MRRFTILGFCLLAFLACDATKTPGDPVTVTDAGSTDGVDNPNTEIPPESASTKRLSIDMVSDSLPIIAGNNADGQPIGWTVDYHGKLFDALSVLSTTLGKPDYVELTEENRDPSALYIKFMTDMTRNVCGQMLNADYAKPEDAASRVITRFVDLQEFQDDATINANLRYLKLFFHAEWVDEGDDAGVSDLRGVFDYAIGLAAEGKEARTGWEAVCNALMSAPVFHLY